MASSIATMTGTGLAPGVSKNRRLYTPEAISRAVDRMQRRIGEGKQPPITQLTGHPGQDAEEDVRKIVGKITSVTLGEGDTLDFAAEIPDTQAGRDLAALTAGEDPYVANVSIRGRWLESTRSVVAEDGLPAETADDLEVVGLDFTSAPGVEGARIRSVVPVTPEQAAAESAGSGIFYESAPVVVEERDTKPYGNVTYADPGYQSDKVKRYPLDSEQHVRAAWSYINQRKNAAKYSPDQVAKIKAKIRAAMKRHGIDAKEAAVAAVFAEHMAPVADARGQVTQTGLWDMVPVDPDGDGDVDALVCRSCGAYREVTDHELNPDRSKDTGQAESTVESDVTEAEKTVAETETATAAAAALSEANMDRFAEKVGAVVVAALSKVAEAKESAKASEPVAKAADEPRALTEAEVTERVRNSILDQLVKEGRIPARKGLVVRESDDASEKQPHEMTPEEWRRYSGQIVSQAIHPAPQAAAPAAQQ